MNTDPDWLQSSALELEAIVCSLKLDLEDITNQLLKRCCDRLGQLEVDGVVATDRKVKYKLFMVRAFRVVLNMTCLGEGTSSKVRPSTPCGSPGTCSDPALKAECSGESSSAGENWPRVRGSSAEGDRRGEQRLDRHHEGHGSRFCCCSRGPKVERRATNRCQRSSSRHVVFYFE